MAWRRTESCMFPRGLLRAPLLRRLELKCDFGLVDRILVGIAQGEARRVRSGWPRRAQVQGESERRVEVLNDLRAGRLVSYRVQDHDIYVGAFQEGCEPEIEPNTRAIRVRRDPHRLEADLIRRERDLVGLEKRDIHKEASQPIAREGLRDRPP